MAVLLIALVLTAFIPVLDNGFLNWDDDKNFLDNPHYRGLGIDQLEWAFRLSGSGFTNRSAWLLFEVEYVFWKLDPRGYHLTSMVLHAINAVVLYVLTVSLLARCRPDSLPKAPGRAP